MLRPNRITSMMVALCLSLLFSAAQVFAQQKQPRTAEEIRAVLDRQVADWNRRDLEGFMSGYWRSPELTFYSGGTRTAGWDETLERYRKSYQAEGREMGRLSFSEIEIEMLGPRSAFVRGRWNLKMSSGDTGGLFTLIFRKLSGGWKIVHDHTGSSS